jgi:hypothetical protein
VKNDFILIAGEGRFMVLSLVMAQGAGCYAMLSVPRSELRLRIRAFSVYSFQNGFASKVTENRAVEPFPLFQEIPLATLGAGLPARAPPDSEGLNHSQRQLPR